MIENFDQAALKTFLLQRLEGKVATQTLDEAFDEVLQEFDNAQQKPGGHITG